MGDLKFKIWEKNVRQFCSQFRLPFPPLTIILSYQIILKKKILSLISDHPSMNHFQENYILVREAKTETASKMAAEETPQTSEEVPEISIEVSPLV